MVASLFSTIASPAMAASPDGLGPWADVVKKFDQGKMNNGQPIKALRSNPEAALGVAEEDTVEGHFVSLGFGGQLTLKFKNGISGGVFVVESTNLPYPSETAKIEISPNGKKWVNAGRVTRTGSVSQPKEVKCAHYIRITDTSDKAIFEPTSDGFDVDGVKAQGSICKKEDDEDRDDHDNDHHDYDHDNKKDDNYNWGHNNNDNNNRNYSSDRNRH